MKNRLLAIRAGLFLLCFTFCFDLRGQMINTIAGNGISGHTGDGGLAVNASLLSIYDVELDTAGNIYISEDSYIRKISKETGIITTIAGTGSYTYNGDGIPATLAGMAPVGIHVDKSGNIFFADQGNHRIRRIDAVTGIVTTIAGNGTLGFSGDGLLATSARINTPYDVTTDNSGNIYIADHVNNRIRFVSAITGNISTICGTGVPIPVVDSVQAATARISGCRAIELDAAGNIYFLTRSSSPNQPIIRKIDINTGLLTFVAGGGSSLADSGIAKQLRMEGINTGGVGAVSWDFEIDNYGNIVYSTPSRLWEINLATGWAKALSINPNVAITGYNTYGFNGDLCEVSLTTYGGLTGVAIDQFNNYYMCDAGNRRVRKYTAQPFTLSSIDLCPNTFLYDKDSVPIYTYQWYKDGVLIPGATSAGYLAMEGGNYHVQKGNVPVQTDPINLPLCTRNSDTVQIELSGTVYYADADQDGFGNSLSAIRSCSVLEGYVTDSTDCNDADSNIYPGRIEICNGIDDDCDGLTDDADPGLSGGTVWYADEDGDGYGGNTFITAACIAPPQFVSNNTDCNDGDSTIHPGATEICNDQDDNCNGLADENAGCDGDGDGFTATMGDCNDLDSLIYPGAPEVCNNMDDDCDGEVDESVMTLFFADADDDGYGNATITITACTQPPGYVEDNTDCDDTRNSVKPGAAEICNGRDDNCDGEIDNGLLNAYYIDADNDGYGNADIDTLSCIAPAGFVSNALDCDDANQAIHPDAAETCNGIDDNCDGVVETLVTYYRDADNDGFGNALVSITACSIPQGYVTNNLDCNDNNAGVHPGVPDVCNNIDEDCDGVTDNLCSVNIYKGGIDDGYATIVLQNQLIAASVYKGEKDDGYFSITVNLPVATSVYLGANDDGYASVQPAPQIVSSFMYPGGNEDGYTVQNAFMQTVASSVYFGGNDDGFSAVSSLKIKVAATIYLGGNDDGFASYISSAQAVAPLIYLGGNDDGFASAAFSASNTREREDIQPLEKIIPSVKIFPNPTEGQLNIVIDNYDENRDWNVIIYDLQGKEILMSSIVSSVEMIDFSDKAPGIYLLVITNNIGFREAVKIIVQH